MDTDLNDVMRRSVREVEEAPRYPAGGMVSPYDEAERIKRAQAARKRQIAARRAMRQPSRATRRNRAFGRPDIGNCGPGDGRRKARA